jgi:hypothetical protein
MRRALGLRGNTPPRSTTDRPVTSNSGSQPPRRRFVRDGEVPVTVIRRDHQLDAEPGTNQLDAARHAIRAEAMAREHAERSLEEARIAIRDLQTNLAHERLARDEAMETIRRQRADGQAVQQILLAVQEELAAERLAHRCAEDALAEALEGRKEAEGRLREAIAAKQARKLAQAPHGLAEATTTRRKAPVGLDTYAERRANNTVRPTVRERRETAVPKIVNDRARMIPARRLGQLAIDGDQKSEIVERRKLRSTGLVTDTSMGRTLRKRGRGRPKGSKNRPKP